MPAALDRQEKQINILDIGEPLMRTWPEDCFLTSIIQKMETSYDWLMNSFIQICAYKTEAFENEVRVNFYPSGKHHYEVNLYDYCPYISKYVIENEILTDIFKEFVDFAIYAISKGYYVSTTLNQFYRNTESEKEKQFFHPTYIYGYDIHKGILYTADNYDNWKYAYKEVEFDVINEAFRHINIYSDMWYEHRTYGYKLRDRVYRFDIKYLERLLEDYILPEQSIAYRENRYDNKYFGIQCYEAYIRYLETLKQRDFVKIDLRSFVFLIDYKTLMERRVQYLVEKGYLRCKTDWLLDSAARNRAESEKILNLAMMYNIRADKSMLDRILREVHRMYQGDYVFVKALIESLS